MNKLIALALVAGLAPFAFADDGNSATITNVPASVVIYSPVTLNYTGKLDFGQVVVTDTTKTATVALNASKVATYTNCAAFNGTISGANGAVLNIPTFTGTKDASLQVGVSSYSATMQDCTIALTQPSVTQSGINFSFPVFGTLTIPANVTGSKSGLVSVTVAYL
jgi:hypothetical protein